MSDAETAPGDIDRETLVDALETYGEDAQIEQTIEECAELIQALYGDDREAVVDELADVRIMVAQLSLLVGEDDVDRRVGEKLARLEQRLEGAHDSARTRGESA
ncbi:nucleoside triphosphate pyrophosphohydrolase family protein [Halobiforma nitratireducens]|uniref:NTP pyrophosphohydrolase MazG-like domain-containing protein n=1 Tax=Halobiforma nitratireducens JCM 10879 TaxID=1227454 RepID=M0LNU0_9EURY|nr:MazG nucleotide pyrophosphohydrolase domain-containing protein [Halobiforma nitratireducens]EMA34119.1 hypothetical protein C446_13559 [Halobiforma nitratireducens JCM 10879]